jgi:hypothetical protein
MPSFINLSSVGGKKQCDLTSLAVGMGAHYSTYVPALQILRVASSESVTKRDGAIAKGGSLGS